MEKIFAFRTVPRILFGIGSRGRLAEETANLGSHAFFMASRTPLEHGDLDDLLSSLRERSIQVEICPGPPSEPELAYVEQARAQCRETGCDVVIGIGGGSVLDASKAVAALVHEPSTVREIFDGQPVTQPGVPFIALPTTAGTGSEVTPNSVLSDPDRFIKQSIRGETYWPRLVINDPELTVRVPIQVKIWSGADALVQAVESFTSLGSNHLTDALAFESFRLIAGSIEEIAHGTDEIEPHVAMADGSMLAGIALANARLGAVHGVAHPMGVRYRIPHGLCCAILLTPVMRFNEPVVREKYERLSVVVHAPVIEWIGDLFRRMGIPPDFRGCRIPRSDVDILIRESLPSGSLKANPRPVSATDLTEILCAILPD
ncbi:MAG TPA: iron-containing alcohol dehydrogenase [bacterium]|nr:iron-containing alcohol dehydrogenase [bacterium]HQP97069.1 iron-containing alcohol dehydrogenase [bacterium]